MHLFYVPDLTGKILSEEESQHAVKVLRLQSGDEIVIIDGKGGYHEAKITFPHPKKCGFEILKSISEFGKRPYKLHIAIAPTKNIERFEWFVEKAVEIGVDEITPLLCRFSERKNLKTERLEKIIISAAKQSLKAYIPRLNQLTSLDEFIKNCQSSSKFIAHCRDEEKKEFKNQVSSSDDILLLIGPEGDFSPEEVLSALKYGFSAVSLGESRLRTETAGIVGCSIVAFCRE
jgi:16S rRNA (uracil1498-N3)-methyltransferase